MSPFVLEAPDQNRPPAARGHCVTLRAANATALRYERQENCSAPGDPDDSGPPQTLNYIQGHDAWSKLYASENFVTWLLDDTFPAEAPVTCEQTVPGHASCADSAA